MTARMKKEFRILLLPWSVAISAAFLLPLFTMLLSRVHSLRWNGLEQAWEVLAGLCIFLACLAMAAMPFGIEIHNRTAGLLLVQPIKRSRIWWSKMLPLFGAFISVGVVFFAGQFLEFGVWGNLLKSWNGIDVLVYVVFFAGVMCSGAFWTLLLRSIIGGMVFPVATQLLLAGVITFFASGRKANVTEEIASGLYLVLAVSAVVYCILFMYLGWRKFSRMQWREGITGESTIPALPALWRKASQPVALRGPWASLLQKELRLHRPVFYLAVIFVVCWLAALVLRTLLPAWEVQFDSVFVVILAIYLSLACLISGCISLGEDKQLGTWGWHLTLPISGVRQWAVKISFALLAALIFGFLLSNLALLAAKVQILQIPMGWGGFDSPEWRILLAVVYCTVLCFWSVTMFGTAVRAVLFTLIGAVVFFFGGVMMLNIGGETLLFQGIWNWIVIKHQLPLYFYHLDWITTDGVYIGLSLLLAALLRQSYVHFRYEPSRKILVRCMLILVISLFLPLWLSSDIRYSCSIMSPKISSLRDNLGEAISALPASITEGAREKTMKISFQEIYETGMLNPDARRWLYGSNILLDIRPGTNYMSGKLLVGVRVNFPSGWYHQDIYWW